ncbi:MAG: hypothetical protein J2P19_06015 [Pseudonocardia sp.]|nr:hypothetical protein [Pseudonocardia sp.]
MASGALRRGVTAVLEHFGMYMWGFPPRMMASVVAELGPARALGWFLWNIPRYQRTLSEFGPVRTHLICTTISLLNGCRYCGHGHAYALELAYLREHGRPFPLSLRAIQLLRGLPPGVIRHRMVSAARCAALHADVRWVERAANLTLAEDRRPTDREDVRISHLVRMFGMLSSIGIAHNTEPDDAALSPLNKDVVLKARYAQVRAGSA